MKKLSNDLLRGVRNQAPTDRLFLPLIAISLIIIVLVSSCGVTPSPEPTDERVACQGESGAYSCGGRSDHEITLDGIPDGITPYLLPVTADFEEFLLGPDAMKEGTTCIFMLAGDLAFYNEDDELITSFDNPVTIKYAFLPQDDEAFIKCQESAAAAGISAEDVEYVPVYYDQEAWKPFKNVVVDTETGLMTIEFTSWGDQPIGGGTKP